MAPLRAGLLGIAQHCLHSPGGALVPATGRRTAFAPRTGRGESRVLGVGAGTPAHS